LKTEKDDRYIYLFGLVFICFSVLIGLVLHSGCISRHDIPDDFYGVVPTEGPAIYHVVKKGETLWRIAHDYGVPLEKVAGVNGIEDPTRIYAGERLIIPGVSGDAVKLIVKDDKFENFTGILQWPLKGNITNVFNPNGQNRHDGIDISASKGTPIHAAAAGRVAYSGDQFSGYGKMIILEHSDSLSTIYAHCDMLLVYEDDYVEAGHIIAKVGATGNASGPHLHFEVRENNIAKNPMEYLK
jgi:LysM repeat protein